MKKKKEKIEEVNTRIDNVRIKSIEMGQETGLTLIFDDPEGVLNDPRPDITGLIKLRPYFCAGGHPSVRSYAEAIGWKFMSLCWVLDHWHHLHAENEIVRVKHKYNNVVAIGNAVLDRWIYAYYNKENPAPDLHYPYFTGVP